MRAERARWGGEVVGAHRARAATSPPRHRPMGEEIGGARRVVGWVMTVDEWVFEALERAAAAGATVREVQRSVDEHHYEELAIDTIEASLASLAAAGRATEHDGRWRAHRTTSKEDALKSPVRRRLTARTPIVLRRNAWHDHPREARLDDFYDLDALLEPEERMIRDGVREFVRGEFLPHVGDWWSEGVFPHDLARRFGDMGMLGVTLPEEYGGAGASATAYGLLNREVEYVDSGLRSFVSVQSSLVMYPIHRWAREELKRRLVAAAGGGEAVGCFGLTEPDAGSDPGAMRTRCRRVGDDWVITGVKRWITSGSRAHVAIVWAREEGGDGRVLGFVVETDRPGSRPSTSRPRPRCARR
jgi:hypothetical protein